LWKEGGDRFCDKNIYDVNKGKQKARVRPGTFKESEKRRRFGTIPKGRRRRGASLGGEDQTGNIWKVEVCELSS